MGLTDREQLMVRRRSLSPGGVGVAVPVTATATSVAVTLKQREQDGRYGVLVTPSWLTTFRVTAKTGAGFTIDFGTAAPSGATFDFLLFRSE